MNSDGVDEYNINKFISEVFSENKCGKVYSMVKDPASRKFDMKEEVTFFHCFCNYLIFLLWSIEVTNLTVIIAYGYSHNFK